MPEYTPTTRDIRALYITGTPKYLGVMKPGAEFDRWLADHDKEVAGRTIEGYRDLIERTTRLHDYAMDEEDWDEHKRLVAALTNYAARIRSGSEGDN